MISLQSLSFSSKKVLIVVAGRRPPRNSLIDTRGFFAVGLGGRQRGAKYSAGSIAGANGYIGGQESLALGASALAIP